MHSRSTWTLVMVALGMFSLIYFFERHHNTTPPPPGPLLPGLNLPAVTSLQVRPGDKDFIRVERTNGMWKLTHPLDYPAEIQSVRILLQALNSLTRQNQIDDEQLHAHKNPQQEYGFDPPQFSLIVKQGEADYSLAIGRTTRMGDEVYVQVVGSAGVFLADSRLLPLLPRSPDDWRERTLVSLPEAVVDRLIVTNGSRVTAFQRDATNMTWRMTDPLPAPADSSRVDKFLRELLEMRVSQFTNAEAQADLGLFGLKAPRLELTVGHGSNAPIVLSFGNTNLLDQVYVRRRDLPGVALVPWSPVEPWTRPHEHFRDHQLVSVADSSVDRIAVKGEGAFTLERASNQTWRVTSPEYLPADSELVLTLLDVMNRLRITKFVKDVVGEGDARRLGLEPPRSTYILSRNDTNAAGGIRLVAQLDFGTNSDDRELVYVRRPDAGSGRRAEEAPIYGIPRADYEKLPTGGWQLRDRTIWNFTTNEVVKITARHDGKVMEVLREPTGKWTLGPGSTGATNRFNNLAVDYTLDSLGHLKAYDLWLDRGPDAPLRNGITEKSLSIELELRGEPAGRKLKVDLRKTPASDWPLAATSLDGQIYLFAFPAGTFIQLLNCLDPAPGSP